ncbi:MAG TPA: hypothetical protein VIK39_17160 [Candidatus Angelobacter sp.]
MLSEDDVARIKQEETIRLETQKAQIVKPAKGWWDFLNSQFALWILSSVVLSLITFYWNHRNDARLDIQKQQQDDLDRQREDSQFLATLLPYLTNTDILVRLRAQEVIIARYPADKVPAQVQLLLVNAVDKESSAPEAGKTDESKRLLASVASTYARVQTSTADDAIKPLLESAQAENKQQQITLSYYRKTVDTEVDHVDFDSLAELFAKAGFKVQEPSTGARNPNLETNALWVADNVTVSQAKYVALVLMNAGMRIRAVRRFRSDSSGASRKLNTIEIGSDAAFLTGPPLTVQQVKDLSDIAKR